MAVSNHMIVHIFNLLDLDYSLYSCSFLHISKDNGIFYSKSCEKESRNIDFNALDVTFL